MISIKISFTITKQLHNFLRALQQNYVALQDYIILDWILFACINSINLEHSPLLANAVRHEDMYFRA